MKTAATYLLAFLFIFLLCPDNSAAQDIEGELKTYAALCDSCLMLKKSLSEGAAVSPDKAKSLIGRFVETGKRLKSMSMTPWQKDIYRIITGRFSRSSYTEPFAAEIPRLPAMQANVTGAENDNFFSRHIAFHVDQALCSSSRVDTGGTIPRNV